VKQYINHGSQGNTPSMGVIIMSAESKVTFKTSDVRVEKDYNADEFPVPAVTFSITSERQDPVIVTITDTIPDELEMDQIGFHPDYGNEHWTAYQEGSVEYEHELKPEESLMTLYGVNLDDPEQAELFMTEPTVEVVPVDEYKQEEEDEVEAEKTIDDTTMDNIPEQDSTDIVREVLQGDRDNVPGLEDQPTEIEMDEKDSADDQEGSSRTAQQQLTVVEALVSEIRSNDVDETNLEFLRQELSTVTPSTETRLGHLQSRMSDLEAYTDSMEELIDQHENMQNQLGTFEDRFANLADRSDPAIPRYDGNRYQELRR
ncbi:MAG: hypothetical protein ABEI86_03495, partial [Halobacteriaceae archaeon]